MAKRSGLASVEEQTAALNEHGVDVIYTQDEGWQEAVRALRSRDDLFVVQSTGVFGRPAFPNVLAALGAKGVDLYSVEADETYPTRDGEAIKRAWTGITNMERRIGHRGGAPVRHDAERIKALHVEGYTNSEIARIVGCSPATVGRKLK